MEPGAHFALLTLLSLPVKVLSPAGLGSSVIGKLALPRALSLVSAREDTIAID